MNPPTRCLGRGQVSDFKQLSNNFASTQIYALNCAIFDPIPSQPQSRQHCSWNHLCIALVLLCQPPSRLRHRNNPGGDESTSLHLSYLLNLAFKSSRNISRRICSFRATTLAMSTYPPDSRPLFRYSRHTSYFLPTAPANVSYFMYFVQMSAKIMSVPMMLLINFLLSTSSFE